MGLIELAVGIPTGLLWITWVHLIGGVYPLGAVSWAVLSTSWFMSYARVKAQDWLWGKLYARAE